MRNVQRAMQNERYGLGEKGVKKTKCDGSEGLRKRSDEGFKNTSEGGHDALQKGIVFASRLPKPRFRGCIATHAHFQESCPLLGLLLRVPS